MRAPRIGYIACALIVGTSAATAQEKSDVGIDFPSGYVAKLAAEMSTKPFAAPGNVADEWAKLSYDQYRDIRFRGERAVWRGQGGNFELHLLPSAWLYKQPITINIVENGRARPIQPDNALFEFGSLAGPPPEGRVIGFSGFRINGPINRPDVFDEIAVFQGASYFRAISRGQAYGLSARGLAINTGEPTGEEFPFFRTFWIETPTSDARSVIVHALLDSPSATGAYTFRVAGGAPTVIDVDVKLFPRRDGMQVGIAPLTSMFLFSTVDRSRISDFRPAVHDSDGLAILNGAGEHIWRPLTNPRRLQISAFGVQDVKGFGLIQRARSFSDYEDLEANYERRPSIWVQPREAWGNGHVHLLEIPSEEEIHDNIVAFWQPLQPYRKAETYTFGYRLSWLADLPVPPDRAVVRRTFSGTSNGPERKSGAIRYVVDFSGPILANSPETPTAALSASAGNVSEPAVQRNPATRGIRVDFLLKPEDAELIELRLELKNGDKTISDVWLARWTK